MAKKVSDNAKWTIGIVITAASLAFGTNLYDRFFEARQIAFDLRTSVPRSGAALLRIVNPSPKTCGPVTVDFTANATLKSARFRKTRPGDLVLVDGRSVQIDISQLAARNGRVLIDFQYEGLVSDTLELKPADTEVGCGALGYTLVELNQRAAPRISSRWLLVAVLAGVIVVVIIIGFFVMDPFRSVL